jgi:small neutral amino acid transporter SnatA (MarC family)
MLFWVAAVLLVITLSASGFFFALHLSTNEMVPLQRARLLWRWSVVVLLGSFDFWIFKRVILGLIALW